MASKIRFSFDEVKATQVASEFIALGGGHFDHYLLCKCLYTLDREALRRWDQPIIGGDYKMYLHGPVISQALDAMKMSRPSFYTNHISRSGNDVSISSDPGREELSKAEKALIKEIFDEWGHLNFPQAREKIHEFPECPESNAPNAIPVDILLRHLGKSEAEIDAIATDNAAINRLNSVKDA